MDEQLRQKHAFFRRMLVISYLKPWWLMVIALRCWWGHDVFDAWLDEMDRGLVDHGDVEGMWRAYTRAKATS